MPTIERPYITRPPASLTPSRLDRAGYWSLVVLVFSLPFELTARPFFNSPALLINNLKILLYLTACLAIISLVGPFWTFMVGLWRRQPDQASFFNQHRLPLALFGLLCLAATLSSLFAGDLKELGNGLKWVWELVVGGLVGLGVAWWLPRQADPARAIRWLGLALVAGGVVSGLVGLGEFVFGMDFAQSLVGWFKVKPTVAGPYLRLSGTFEYANIAAMYYELALPFALSGLGQSLARRHWLPFVGWTVATGVVLEALFLTLSRGAWLGLAVGLLVMAGLTGRRASRRQWWPLLAGTLGGAALLIGATFLILPQVGLRLASQSDQDWYKAVYTADLTSSMTVCQELSLPVRVTNQGPLTWSASSQLPYNLSYHWLSPSDDVVVFEGIRTGLTSDLKPGGNLSVLATVRAPQQPGQYRLVWDMVQEEISWFSLKSPTAQRWPVTVSDLPAAQKSAACGELSAQLPPRRATPKELPKVLTQPNRSELWKAALRMIQARPILGVGPDAFRLNYGPYAQPSVSDWDRNIFANSLPLEIGADLGLLGGGLYAAFLVAILWPCLRRLFGRDGPGGFWPVALVGALAAFFAHGLLDYILGSHAINTLFWVLLGLAMVANLSTGGFEPEPDLNLLQNPASSSHSL